jgi:Skp family chaperone for outer membrane proteins
MSKLNRKSLFVATGSLAAMLAFTAYRHTASAQLGATPPPATPAVPTATPTAPPPAAPPAPAVVLPPPAGQINPARIAYVNLGKLFDNSKQFKDLKAALEAKANELKITQAANEIAMKNLVADRDQSAVGTADWTRKQIDLQKKGGELQLQQKLDQIALQRQQAMGMKDLYAAISAATAKVAAAKQIDLVMIDNGDDIPADASEMTAEALGNAINSHHILFASKGIDITGNVGIELAAAATAPAPGH